MPPAYSPTQRNAIAQFVNFTSVKESVAAKHLKAQGWNVQQAIDAYYQNANSSTANASTTKPNGSNINKLFDKYRDDPQSPDTIGTEGTMKYLNDLGVKIDEPLVLAVHTELSAPTMGELTRDGFTSGWKSHNVDNLTQQQMCLPIFRTKLRQDPEYFRRVYRHSFFLARMSGQRAIQLDTALDLWRLLFGPDGMQWSDAGRDWLSMWVAFLEAKWTKSVNKDMWDQTGVFALKCLHDAHMGWYSADGPFPAVLDDFVVYMREKLGDKAGGGAEGDKMDVE